MTRQQMRRRLWQSCKAAVNKANLRQHKRDKKYNVVGMLRAERRKLAKAYMAGAWQGVV